MMRLYVNGEQDGASSKQSGPILYAATAPFVIGRYKNGDKDYPLEGAIKEVRIYKRALKSEEIAAQFEADKALSEALPVLVAPRFVIAPYLQWPTRDSMTIMWETNTPGDGSIEFDTALPPRSFTSRQAAAVASWARLDRVRCGSRRSCASIIISATSRFTAVDWS
jgi:acid phosphatase type 7